ncbi:MAG: hypothetical protein IAE89_02805 [Anaerolineae bacterium]|nr:hypothetical protein [Anaerolineae bacterium]
MRNLRASIGLFVLLISIMAATIVAVQSQDQVTTPTPAPVKSATPGPTSTQAQSETSEAIAELSQTDSDEPFTPLTQADLQSITGNVQRPNGITYFNDYLYISCTGDGTVYETNSRTGQTRAYIFGVTNAHSMIAEEINNQLVLWVPDYGENSIKRVSRDGVATVADEFEGPWALIPYDEDQFLVSNLLGGSVDRVTRDGEVEVLIDDLAGPTGLALDGDLLYVGNNGSTRRSIEWFDLSAAEPTTGPLLSGIQNTTGLQLAADGNLYFAYALGTRGVIGRIDPVACRENGGCTNEQVEIVVYTELATPLAGLTVTPDMRLFVHTMFNPSVYWGQIGEAPASEG